MRQVVDSFFADALRGVSLQEGVRELNEAFEADVKAGVHQLSVNGKRKDIADADFLAVGDRFAIGTAKDVVAEVRAIMEAKDKERGDL